MTARLPPATRASPATRSPSAAVGARRGKREPTTRGSHWFVDDPARLHQLVDAVLGIGSDLELREILRRLVEAGCAITEARYGALGVLDDGGTRFVDFVHVGVDRATIEAIGRLPEGAGVLGVLIADPRPIRIADVTAHPASVGFPPAHPPMRSFLGVPVLVRGRVFGNLYLTEKRGGSEFSAQDEALVVALATAAGVAIDHARLQERVRDLTLVAERERLARDLHDTVIQRLFATGLALQAALGLVGDGEVRARLQDAIADLDETIRHVRTTIFALEPPRGAAGGVRARALDVCAQAARGLGFDPEVRFSGPIEHVIGEPLATDVLAVLREALSNVARHAKARRVQVALDADPKGAVTLLVIDDGVGLPSRRIRRGRGMTNIRERAERWGGTAEVSKLADGGTQVRWWIPAVRPSRS